MIHTALDLKAQELARDSLQKNLVALDRRRGWRGVISGVDASAIQARQIDLEDLEFGDPIKAVIVNLDPQNKKLRVSLGEDIERVVDLRPAKWANRYRDQDDKVRSVRPEKMLRRGDVIEVSKVQGSDKWVLDQSPEVEGAFVCLDPHTGQVLALIGGYSYNRSVFNRATQSLRQPGSAFKPIVYLAAVDGFGYTPATIVLDEPRTFKVGTTLWSPGNFDKDFKGPITLRRALELSRNLVSADIISRIGVDAVIDYAKRMGIKSELGRNLSLSLGSSEVTLLELSRAYGVFAAEGVLFDSVFIIKIINREGESIFDYSETELEAG